MSTLSKFPEQAHSPKKRYVHFDVLRGIAIFLVVVAHIVNHRMYTEPAVSTFNLWLTPIRMPMFLLLAGFCSASAPKLSFKAMVDYWSGKAIRFLIPLFFIPILYTVLLVGKDWDINDWIYILYHEYWFTKTIFLIFGIFYVYRLLMTYLFQKSKAKNILEFLSALVLLGVIFVVSKTNNFLTVFFNFGHIEWLFKYFLLGYLLARSEKIRNIYSSHLTAAISLIVVLLLTWYKYTVGEQFFLMEEILTICFLSFVYTTALNLATEKGKISKILSFIGREASPIYLTHFFFLFAIPKALCESIVSIDSLLLSLGLEITVTSICAGVIIGLSLLVITFIKANPILAMCFYGVKPQNWDCFFRINKH